MLTTSPNELVLMTRPPELAGQFGLINEGALIKDATTGRIAGHMVEVAKLPQNILQTVGSLTSVLNLGVSVASFAYMRSQFNALNQRLNQIERKVDVIDQKLNILVGMVQRIDTKIDALASIFSSLTGKIDARHRDDVFSEIGAVLDTLGYADRKTPKDASTLVVNNITPARKAIRRFESLIEEYESFLGEDDFGLTETLRMRLMLGMLSIKIDLSMGETHTAFDQAMQLKESITQRGKHLTATLLQNYPLQIIAPSMEPKQLIQFCTSLEIVDDINPLQRLAFALTSFSPPDKPKVDLATRGNFATIVLKCGIEGKHGATTKPKDLYAQPVILCYSVNYDEMSLPGGAGKMLWHADGSLQKKIGDPIKKGEALLKIRLENCNKGGERVMTGEFISPIDGVLVEDLIAKKLAINTWGGGTLLHADTGICKILATQPEATSNTPRQHDTNTANLVAHSVETLARIISTANGMAAETSLLTNAEITSTITAPLLASPFNQDYVIVSTTPRTAQLV